MQKKGIYLFQLKKRYYAVSINETTCVELDALAYDILKDMLTGLSDPQSLNAKYTNKYDMPMLDQCINECTRLLKSKYFRHQPSVYRHQKQNIIQAVTLHVSHDCNLNCSYCYADAGTFGGKPKYMDQETMQKSIDFAFANAQEGGKLNLGFFGGEPLMNFELIRFAVAYAKAKARNSNIAVTFSMTTNATLLNSEAMDFISKEQFSLIFSIDGPRETHDKMRKYPSGKGSHTVVLNNILTYNANYSRNFTARGTFTRATPEFSEQVLFLNEQGFGSISVEPSQLDASNPDSLDTPDAIQAVKHEYDRLAEIYVESLRKDKPLHFFHFDYYLKKMLKPQPIHTQCGAGGGLIAITPDGRIFPCFEAVAEPENCIGHVDTGIEPELSAKFQSLHADLKKPCRSCWAKYYCGGGCHALGLRYNHDVKTPYKPNCEFMKHRIKLTAWILSEVRATGHDGIDRLKSHLNS